MEELKSHLRGVQRVPALLLLNLYAPLEDMNLFNYEVLPFEPLHDLKGHIAKLLDQLPSVITNAEPLLWKKQILQLTKKQLIHCQMIVSFDLNWQCIT